MLTNISQENAYGYHGKKNLGELLKDETYLSESLVKLLELPNLPGQKVTLSLDLIKTMFMGGLFQS